MHSQIIVPPSWIVKLPRKGSFKSSLRRTPKKKTANKKKSKEKEQKTFVIKPIPTSSVTPVLVFINPKSGGNQVSVLSHNIFTRLKNFVFFFVTKFSLLLPGCKVTTKISVAS